MEVAVGLDDAEWFLVEADHDVKAFRKATSGFVSNHVPILSTSYDDPGFWDALKRDINGHAKRIAQDAGCSMGPCPVV